MAGQKRYFKAVAKPSLFSDCAGWGECLKVLGYDVEEVIDNKLCKITHITYRYLDVNIFYGYGVYDGGNLVLNKWHSVPDFSYLDEYYRGLNSKKYISEEDYLLTLV